MKLHARGLIGLAVFGAALTVGVAARSGQIDPIFLLVGMVGFVAVESLVFLGPLLFRPR